MPMVQAMFVKFSALALATLATPQIAVAGEEIEAAPLYVSPAEWAAGCEPWDDWDKPAPPMKITHNVYYVGTCGITVLLVPTDDGHVLIDTGTQSGALVTIDNIKRLGADPQRVSLILYSHEHFDHVGGLSLMQWVSGAPVLSAPEAVDVFRTGKDNPDDPQAGLHEPMQPARNVIQITPGVPVSFGGFEFNPIATPGHSPGALAWQWESCNGDDCKSIVYADSMSPISRDDYKFSDHPEYVAAYREGIARIAALECDILLTPHPSHSKMIERAATGTFEGGVSCAEYAAGKHRDLDARLERETGADQ